MFSFLGQLDVRTIKNTHVVGGMASSRLGYNHYCTGQDGKDAMNILEKGIDAEEFLAKSKACINRGLKTGMWYRFVKHFVKKNQDKICTLWRPTLESNVQNTIPGAMSIEGETTAFNSLERHEDSISPFEVLQHFAQKAIENRPEADMERERAVEFMEVVRAINQVCQNVNTESGEELLTDYGKGAFEHPKDAFGCFAGSYLAALISELFNGCEGGVGYLFSKDVKTVEGDWMDGYLASKDKAVERFTFEKENRPKESALADLERDLSTLSTMVIRA